MYMNLEKLNYNLYILSFICCIIILIIIFKLLFFRKNKSKDEKDIDTSITFLIIISIILFILLCISISLNHYLIYEDKLILKNDFIFSTKIINNDNNLITYPLKSILNLDNDINNEYDIKQNQLIEYNNLTNNYLINNNIMSKQNFNLSIEKYNQYTDIYNKIINEYELNYRNYIQSYEYIFKKDKYSVCRYYDMKWCIFKHTIIENKLYYTPVCLLYFSYIYNYYRLIDINNNELLCKLLSIGPDYIYDININKYYTIYGSYSLYIDNQEQQNISNLQLNKKLIINNYLSMLLPFTFSTKLKITNYLNNFK